MVVEQLEHNVLKKIKNISTNIGNYSSALHFPKAIPNKNKTQPRLKTFKRGFFSIY